MSETPPIGEPISEAEAIARLEQRQDPSQRYYAAWWLGRMRSQHPRALPLLVDAVKAVLVEQSDDHDALFVARNAARALGKLESSEAIAVLEQALAHHDHDLREAAARSLAEIGNPCVLGALAKRLGRSGAGELSGKGTRLQEPCDALVEAIGDLARGQQDQRLMALVEPFTRHERPVLRSSAYRALLLISGDQRWGQELLQLLEDARLQVRRAVLMDLGACGWREAAQALASCPAENSLKLIALRGLVEQPLLGGAPAALGDAERNLLTLMDQLL
ncbi:MAG: HEAT repeat domain-containing protein [Synechococcus sp.]|nr:HEAT repeat domain-containing protein [Synechococcus sp.]